MLAYLAMGYPNTLIGYHLGLADSTVSTRIAASARKLGAGSRVELVQRLTRARSDSVPADAAPPRAASTK